MSDFVGLVLSHYRNELGEVFDPTLLKEDLFFVSLHQPGQRASAREHIKVDDPIAALYQHAANVTADEAGAAGDQDSVRHGWPPQ